MSTTTGSNALPVPQSSDSPDVVRDITALANAVDPMLGAYVCTSTTRPASPTPGERVVWETDTKRLSYYDGTNWHPMSNVPVCVINTVVAQSVANNTQTVIAMDTAVEDADALADLTNDRIVIKTPGLYICGGTLIWSANSTGFRSAVITKNGAAIADSLNGANAWITCLEPVSAPVRLAANDYIRLEGGQNCGAALSTRTTEMANTLWVRYVGA